MEHPPFRLGGLDHIVLRIADLDRAMAFYCGVLGCTLERDRPDLGLTQLRAGRSLIDLVTLDGPLGSAGGEGPSASGRNLDHFAITIAPLDEPTLRRHLAAAGVAIGEVDQRLGAEGIGPSMYICDPDGNVVELKGPSSTRA